MSNGALPKPTTSQSSVRNRNIEEQQQNASVQNSNSDFSFELKPKPKLTCIPESSCSKFLSDLRKTQSMNVTKKNEIPEKSWSVLFIGSKSNVQRKGLIMN